MKITPDTNVLVRAAVAVGEGAGADAAQARQAIALLRRAELIAVTVPVLCEFVWVLRRLYGHGVTDAGRAIRALCAGAAVTCDRAVIEEGLRFLDAGGDFADGAIAALGRDLGADLFVSFDRRALRLVRAAGHRAEPPAVALGEPSDAG